MDSASLVRDLRTRHRLSQAQLARRAGTTQARISALERGLASPGVELLERLATACGEELVLATRPRPAWHDDDADLRARFRALSMDERLAAASVPPTPSGNSRAPTRRRRDMAGPAPEHPRRRWRPVRTRRRLRGDRRRRACATLDIAELTRGR